jgi:hypothetical protein
MLVTRPSRTRIKGTAVALALAALPACDDRPLVVGEWIISHRGNDDAGASPETEPGERPLPPQLPPPPDPCAPAAPLVNRAVTLPAAELARRLAFYLWRQPADESLTTRLAGVKDTRGLRAVAATMLRDPRVENGVAALARDWLNSDAILQVDERAEIAGQLVPELRQSMAQEPALALSALLMQPSSPATRLEALLTSPVTYVDQRLATIYGAPTPVQTGAFVRAEVPDRSGLLTQAGFMAANPRAPHRGEWLFGSFLCSQVPAPPAPPSNGQPVMMKPGQSYRDAFNAVNEPACTACHAFLESGWAMEHFDLLGRYRSTDNGAAIDSSARLRLPRSNVEIVAQNARDLGQKMAAACEVRACVARTFLAHAVGKATHEVTDEQLLDLARAFAYADADLPTLLLDVVETEAFLAP